MPTIDYLVTPFEKRVVVYEVNSIGTYLLQLSNPKILQLNGIEKIALNSYFAMMPEKDEPLPGWWPPHIPDPKKKKKNPNQDRDTPRNPEVPLIPPFPGIDTPQPYQLGFQSFV